MQPPPPYPGLVSFGDDDDAAELFFGRRRERDLIIANLRAARLTVLYGPSGVGKSSLLHAGVVHRLRAEAQPDPDDDGDEAPPRTSVVIVDDWSGDAAARLATRIRELEGHREGEHAGGNGAVADAVAGHAGSLLIILDGFEEHIRLHPDARDQDLDDAIRALAGDPRLSVRILIAIREDRLAALDRFRGSIPQLLGNVLRLGPLSPEAALDAIEGPIERYAAWAREGRGGFEASLESGLASTVRDELVALSGRRRADPSSATGRADGEPWVEAAFLQLVMRRLWDEDVTTRGDTTLRHATLRRLGGAERIVASHLDAALNGLAAGEQALTAEMLRYLITPSGVTACLTAHDLSDYTGHPEPEVEALAEKLSRPPARILRGIAAAGDGPAKGGYELPQVLVEPALDWRTRFRTLRLELRARRLLLALVAMTAVATALVAYALDPQALRRLELTTVDARFDLRGASPADPRIVLVTIDDDDFRRLGTDSFRATFARALRSLEGAGPRAVAINVTFSDKRDPRAADRALIGAVRGPLHERLVLTTDRLDEQGKAQLFGRVTQVYSDRPDPPREHRPARTGTPAVGFEAFRLEPDDAVRRFDREVALGAGAEPLDHFAVVAARLAQRRQPAVPDISWIDYRGGPGTFPGVPFYDVVDRRPAALARLRGKIVVLGTDEVSARTSAPGSGEMLGPEIQANAIATALDDAPLRSTPAVVDILLIVALGLVPLGLALRLRPALIAPAALAAAAATCIAAYLAFTGGRVMALVTPLASLLLATAGVAAVLLLRARRARRTLLPHGRRA